MKSLFPGCLTAAICLFAFPLTVTAAPEEHLQKPDYIVTFEGEVAYNSNRGTARVGSDTREDGDPVRTVMEFALPSVTDPAEIRRATLSILTSGGSRGGGMLHYALFAFDGDGVLSEGEGLGGKQIAGPYEYDIDHSAKADISKVDVLAFVREAVAKGATHAGFALRDINTEPDFRSDQQSIFAGKNAYGGSRPPLLIIHTDDDPEAGDMALATAGNPVQPGTLAADPDPEPAAGEASATAAEAIVPFAEAAAAASENAEPAFFHETFDNDYKYSYRGNFLGLSEPVATGASIGAGCLRGNNDGFYRSDRDGPVGSSSRTISIWFRTDANTGPRDALIGWGDWQANGDRYDFRLDGSDLRIEAGTSGHTFRIRHGIRDGQWHHALLAFSGGRLSNHRLYVDGKYIGRARSSATVNTVDYWDIRIGSGILQQQGGNPKDRDFSGWIDDVGVFPTALSAIDAALIHGLGSIHGIDLGHLDEFRALWEGPQDGLVKLDGKLWIKTSGLSGPLGSTGGTWDANDAFVVLDNSGNGIRVAPATTFAQLEVSGGDIEQDLDFGKDATVLPTLRNTGGNTVFWQMLWEDRETIESLENTARNAQRNPSLFLDLLSDRHLFGGGETGNSIKADSGFYYSDGNRIFLESFRVPYTGGEVVEEVVNEGVARYFTRNYGGVFNMVADLENIPYISLAGHYRVYSDAFSEFSTTAPNGTAYRAFVRTKSGGSSSTVPTLHQVILVPDVPEITLTQSPFKVAGLPPSCRLHYLMFGRPNGAIYSQSSIRILVENYFLSLANGVPWAWTETPSGTAAPGVDLPLPIRLDSRGLAPGSYSTRYAVAPEGVLSSEVPEDAWQQLAIHVGEPDFDLPEPKLALTALAGLPETTSIALDPLAGQDLVVTGLTSGQAWLTASVSDSQPNQVDLRFDSAGLAPGLHTATLAIDTATTRQILTVQFTVEAQKIVRLLSDPQRNRIYAIHRPDSGEGRLLVYDGHDGQFIASLALGSGPGSLSLRPDGSELYVLHADGFLWRIDPDNFSEISRRDYSSAGDRWNWDARYPSAVAAGPGSIAYIAAAGYIFSPIYVVDVETGDLLQDLPEREANTWPDALVQDLVFHAGRSDLFTWDGFGVRRYAASAEGLLEKVDSYNAGMRINDFTERYGNFHLSRDGRNLIVNNRGFDPDDLSGHRMNYPQTVQAITPNAELLSTSTRLLDPDNAAALADLPTESLVQEISPDYSRLFYFNQESKQLESLDLIALVGEETLGLRFEPADGATVLPPEILRWKPMAEAAEYRVYLADSREALADPDPSLLLATTADHWLVPSAGWEPGTNHFWRVDGVGADGTVIPGTVLAFRVSGISADRAKLKIATVEKVDGRTETLVIPTDDTALPWTATADQAWIVPTPGDGTLEVRIDATDLVAGDYRGSITLEKGGDQVSIPVTAWIRPLEVRQVISSPGQPFVYLRSEYQYSNFQGAFMLRFNTDTERFDRVAEIPMLFNDVFGSLASGSTFHPDDNCIYIAYGSQAPAIARLDLDSFRLDGPPVPVQGLPASSGWSSSAPVIAGPAGRLILGRSQTWLVDTATMSVVGPPLGGLDAQSVHSRAYDPGGHFLYLDIYQNDRQRWLVKYRMDGDTPTELTSAVVDGYSYTRGEPMLLSDDGSLLCRGRSIYDPDLTNRSEISNRYFKPAASNAGGGLVCSNSALFNANNGLEVGTLAGGSQYLAVASDQRRLFQFGWRDATWTITDLHALTALSADDVTPDIPDGAIRFNTRLPLTWQHQAAALSYQVYLGTDAAAVAAAGPGDAEFFGGTTGNSLTPPDPLSFDQQYFWRIDVIGYTGEREGGVHSFRTASFDTTPLAFSFSGPVGIPLPVQEITLDAPDAVAWTAATAAPWIHLTETSGTTPSTLHFEFLTDGLAVGDYEGVITFTSGGQSWDYPVSLTLETSNITIARSDPDSGRIFAISQVGGQRPGDDPAPANLIEYDAATGQALRFVATGTSVGDLQVDPAENRIYITHWKTNRLRVLDRTTLEEINVFPLDGGGPWSLAVGTAGQIVTGGSTTPTELRMIDARSGSVLDTWSPVPLALEYGTHVFLPGNRYLIHSEGKGGMLYKLDTSGEQFTPLAETLQETHWTSNRKKPPVLVAAAGSRVFSENSVYDADLNLLGTFEGAALAVTDDGSMVFTDEGIHNVSSGLKIGSYPANLQTLALAEPQGKLWIFSPNKPQPTELDLADFFGLDPDGSVTPLIPDSSTVIGRSQTLAWELDPKVFSYQIYFGTDAAAVAAATPDSPEFLGSTEGGTMPAPGPLTLGGEFFWRIDAIGYAGARKGGIFSFRVAPVEIDPNALDFAYPAGVPILEQELAVTADTPTAWSATTSEAWITILTPVGTSPDTLRVTIDPTSLAVGQVHTGSIRIDAGGHSFDLPVSFNHVYMEIFAAVADRERPLLYAVSGTTHGAYQDRPAFLVVFDAITEKATRAVQVGTGGATNISIHYPENRIYVSNPRSGDLVVLDRDTFETVATYNYPPETYATSIVGPVAAGPSGRAMLCEWWENSRVRLLDTGTGAILSTSFFDGHPHYWDLQKGSGVFDPSNRWFYFGESGGQNLVKFDTTDDRVITETSFTRSEGNPGPVVLRNAEGSKYFWGGHMLDPDLNLLWDFTNEAPGNWGNHAVEIDETGERVFAYDSLNVIRVFDTTRHKYLFKLHQVWGSNPLVYSIPTGKLFDFASNIISSVVFEAPIEPLYAPPGLVWASGGASPWMPADAEEPGTMVSSPKVINNRGSLSVVHIPNATTVSCQLRGKVSAWMNEDYNSRIIGTSKWTTAQFEVPEGGGFITWYSDASSDTNLGYVRDIAIMRGGPIRPPEPIDTGLVGSDEELDDDGDGSSNLLEWAAGGDSNNPRIGPHIVHFIDNGEFVFRFKRRLGMRDTTLVAEASTDMQIWQPLGFPDVRQVDIDSTYETLEVRFSFDSPTRFVRLRAEGTDEEK